MKQYNSSQKPFQSVTCHIGSHSVTCHSTQANSPCLNPQQTGQNSICLPQRDWRLSWPRWLVIYWACSSVQTVSLQLLTHKMKQTASNKLTLNYDTQKSNYAYADHKSVFFRQECRWLAISFILSVCFQFLLVWQNAKQNLNSFQVQRLQIQAVIHKQHMNSSLNTSILKWYTT